MSRLIHGLLEVKRWHAFERGDQYSTMPTLPIKTKNGDKTGIEELHHMCNVLKQQEQIELSK